MRMSVDKIVVLQSKLRCQKDKIPIGIAIQKIGNSDIAVSKMGLFETLNTLIDKEIIIVRVSRISVIGIISFGMKINARKREMAKRRNGVVEMFSNLW